MGLTGAGIGILAGQGCGAIKDIKTYIRAMRTVVNRMPDAQGWIAGPEDEDPDYAGECRNLVDGLGLNDNVKFLGFQQMTELLPKIGLVVLSSISEGLPLVLLEGFAAGVPAVSTDVGSCRQLIFGLDQQDQSLGAAGRIVGIADPQALAEAALELLTDVATWNEASQAGIRRVEAHYTQEKMFASYQSIYESVTTWQG
ncbi:MAG: GT4 family glycosyltransferase PelF, partial [Pseudomonadota bacterium]